MIYFDAAATTLEKPARVRHAVWRAINGMSSPGRGNYPASRLAAETAFHCRTEAAEFFGVENPENVIFTYNATHALNMAIRSLVHPGGRVVISGYEHNAVTRVLHAIPNLTLTVVNTPLFQPEAAVRGFQQAIARGADAVICNHVSNVFGYILPVEQIALECRKQGVPFLIDASQSAGVVPIRMNQLGASFIAMPGHKGLYGPQGTGLLLCATDHVDPILFGGTGSASRDQSMPAELPDRLEAGTHNMPGIAGLLEGIRFVKEVGPETIGSHERRLAVMAAGELRKIPNVRTFAADQISLQTGVISFYVERTDCETLAERLSEKGIAVRAGLHCAPLAHRTAGTLQSGTVRVSFSAFNTARQVEQFLAIFRQILRENVTL